MATTIITKNGSGAPLAGDLTAGELAVDLTNKRLYSKDSGGTVIELGTTPSAISGGTIDNTVIGGTTAAAGTFTDLTATSSFTSVGIDDNATSTALTVTDSGIAATLTTAAQPNITSVGTLTGFTSTGIDDNATSTAITIDSSENVGIGTSDPTSVLHIQQPADNSGLTFGHASRDNEWELELSGANNENFAFKRRLEDDTESSYYLFGTSGHFWYGGTTGSSSERMRIDASGNVGIGTDDPDSKLEVRGVAGSASRVHISSGSSGQTSFDGSGSGLLLTATNMNTTSKFTPAIQFGSMDVNFTTTNPKVGAAINAVAQETYSADDDGGMSLVFYTTPTAPGTGQTTTERMRIDSSGNLLVGKTSATYATPGAQIEANGTAAFTRDSFYPLLLNRETSGGGMIQFYINDVASGQITTTSGGTPAFASGSDARLKENVADHAPELPNIMSIQIRTWDWKDGRGGGTGEGVVAQELQQTGWADLVSEDDDGYLQVAGFGKVETRLIKAIQEQQAMIETLQAQVAELQGAN